MSEFPNHPIDVPIIFRFVHQCISEQFRRFFVEFESFFNIYGKSLTVFMHQSEIPMGEGLTTSRC